MTAHHASSKSWVWVLRSCCHHFLYINKVNAFLRNKLVEFISHFCNLWCFNSRRQQFILFHTIFFFIIIYILWRILTFFSMERLFEFQTFLTALIQYKHRCIFEFIIFKCKIHILMLWYFYIIILCIFIIIFLNIEYLLLIFNSDIFTQLLNLTLNKFSTFS